MEGRTYETTDMGIVAFLRCKGYKVSDLKRDGSKVVFVFDDQAERKQLVLDYFNGAQVSCIDFQTKLVEARTMMRQIR